MGKNVLTCILLLVSFWISGTVDSFAQKHSKRVIGGEYFSIFSKSLNEKREIIVHLPRDYAAGNESYPVLYVLDGEWEPAFMAAVGTASHVHESHKVPQMIVVGICNTIRNRDMIPVKVGHRPASGGSLNFLGYITKELQPYINKNYRTKSFNILFGGSNAGLFCLYALLENPKSFNAYITASPMVGHCKDFIYSKTKSFFNNWSGFRKSERPCFIYMIYGKYDFRRVTSYIPEYYRYLKSKTLDGLFHGLKMIEDDGHVPYTSLFYGLRFVFSQN